MSDKNQKSVIKNTLINIPSYIGPPEMSHKNQKSVIKKSFNLCAKYTKKKGFI